MLFYFFKVLFIYLGSLFRATFSFKGNKALYLSGLNLTKRSFRLSQNDYRDPLIIVKGYIRLIKAVFSEKKETYLTTGSEFIYDLNPDPIRKPYVKHFTGKDINNLISKEHLAGNMGMISKFIVVSVYLLILVPFFMFTVFSKHKPALSLIFKEVVENAMLLSLISRYKLKTCYFFSIYEKDANLTAYLLMKSGVKVIKIPSEVPFYFFNTTIICDQLIICNAYQFGEKEYYKESILCDSTEMWGPERVTDFYSIYKNKNYAIRRNAIAFYSTASWVREKEGHLDQGTGMVKNEKLLLEYLKEYLRNSDQIKLIIYPHPKEKKNIEATRKHYRELLQDLSFEFSDFKELSAATFYNAELAVAFNSTLIHERLYFGFKTLILPLDHPGFPIEGSSFRNICAYSKEELFSKVDMALQQTEEEFFQTNGLQNYRFK
jgi:hypothetical protein